MSTPTLAKRLEAAVALEALPKLAWEHSRLGINISISGSQISFTNDGDYVSLKEAQATVKYLAEQLGLKVK
jgi:hypothetical protein